MFPEHFVPVMKYMGDHPTKQNRSGNELTDEIFEPALKHVRSTRWCSDTFYRVRQKCSPLKFFAKVSEQDIGHFSHKCKATGIHGIWTIWLQ